MYVFQETKYNGTKRKIQESSMAIRPDITCLPSEIILSDGRIISFESSDSSELQQLKEELIGNLLQTFSDISLSNSHFL
jgi:hypothetical protein